MIDISKFFKRFIQTVLGLIVYILIFIVPYYLIKIPFIGGWIYFIYVLAVPATAILYYFSIASKDLISTIFGTLLFFYSCYYMYISFFIYSDKIIGKLLIVIGVLVALLQTTKCINNNYKAKFSNDLFDIID